MNLIFVKLKSILQDAVDNDEMPKNPLAGVKAPKIDKTPRKALTREQAKEFVHQLISSPINSHTVALSLAVLGGLRRGEILGLQWRDINNGVMNLCRSVNEKNELMDRLKTDAGFRAVPVMPQLAEILSKWQAIQKDQLKAIGFRQKVDTQVVTSETGGLMHPQNLDRWWRQNRGDYGLDGYVIHELRHTLATFLGNSGVPARSIQSIMGWSDIAMANHYVHDDAEINQAAIYEVSRIMGSLKSTVSDTRFRKIV